MGMFRPSAPTDSMILYRYVLSLAENKKGGHYFSVLIWPRFTNRKYINVHGTAFKFLQDEKGVSGVEVCIPHTQKKISPDSLIICGRIATSGSDSWPFCDVKPQSVNRNDPPSQLARSQSLESLRVSCSLKTIYGRTHISVLNVAAAALLPPPVYMTIGCGHATDGSDMESLSSQEDPFADEVVIHTRTGAYT